MSAKKGGKASRKKQVFDPYVRLSTCTAPVPALGSGAPPSSVFPAAFIDTVLTITPPVPRTEVGLKVQFRCTVDLIVGDSLTIHLPGFKGPTPRIFSLESLPHPDGINCSHFFMAFWAGDTKPRKIKGVVGLPGKQTILLRCLRKIEENSLVTFAVPFALGLVCPDKLALNSSKIKIEGPSVRHAEGGRIPRQGFLACTAIKKMPVVEELDLYDAAIADLVEAGNLGKEDRLVAEDMLFEDVEQMNLAVVAATLTTPLMPQQHPQHRLPCRQRPYPVAMPWPVAERVFHDYEEAGAFVKKVMEGALLFIKKHDALAVHREVAANWGVKIGAVVLLEDMLAARYAAMYPGITRSALLALHLLAMEPVDVGRTFPVSVLPAHSIQQDLVTAFRMHEMLSAAPDLDGEYCGVPRRTEVILGKWNALVSTLLTASLPVTPDPASADSDGDAVGDGKQSARVRFELGPAAAHSGPDGGAPLLTTPPPLYTGIRELPSEELHHVQQLKRGDWYVFPSFTVATEICPAPSLLIALERENSAEGSLTARGRGGSAATAATASAASGSPRSAAAAADEDDDDEGNNNNDDDDDDDGGDASTIPESAVLFEVRGTVEALELADLSLYPYSRQWLLPFSSSFRVVSVTVRPDLNNLTHVVLEMAGSLVGEVADAENIPDGDRVVAKMVNRKLRTEGEKGESKTPFIAQLSYLHARRSERRRLHPPTLMRAQYLSQFHEAKRTSEAHRCIEEGTVSWQIRSHPPQVLQEGVVKPSVWEPLHRRYAPLVEQLFLSRTRTRNLIEDTNLNVSLSTFTADYGGRGPRPIRRLVGKHITHEPGLEEGVHVYGETRALIDAATAQITQLNIKLGIQVPGANGTAAAAGTQSSASGKGGSKKAAAAAKKKGKAKAAA